MRNKILLAILILMLWVSVASAMILPFHDMARNLMHPSISIVNRTNNFNGALSSTDVTVQEALDTLDDVVSSYHGEGTFNSTTGTEITIGATMPTDTYSVLITQSGTPPGDVGEIGVINQSTTTFEVVITGANTTAPFKWVVIP